MKRKHIPERTCVGCRLKRSKYELLRFAYEAPDQIVFDPKKRLPGRGAYLCGKESCLEKAVKKRALSRAYRASVSPKTSEALKRAFNEAIARES